MSFRHLFRLATGGQWGLKVEAIDL